MMDLDAARQLLACPVPVALAAKAFGCQPELLVPLAKDGAVALGEAFRLARRQAEERLRAIRFARRSAMMRARRSNERAARAFISPDRLALVLASLRAATSLACEDLATSLRPLAPRLADLASPAGEAVLEADLIAALRLARRAAS